MKFNPSINMAARHGGDKKHYRECCQNPRFGFCWWFWFPRISKNTYPEHSDVDIFWLCFFFSCWWSTVKRAVQ